MALQITGYKRVFKFERNNEKVTLDDPNPDFSPEEVLIFYSHIHSELTTATIDGPNIEGEVAVYEFTTTVGTKG